MKMFPRIVKGLRRAGYSPEELLYFSLHMEQDIDHGAWLEEYVQEKPIQSLLIAAGVGLLLGILWKRS